MASLVKSMVGVEFISVVPYWETASQFVEECALAVAVDIPHNMNAQSRDDRTAEILSETHKRVKIKILLNKIVQNRVVLVNCQMTRW